MPGEKAKGVTLDVKKGENIGYWRACRTRQDWDCQWIMGLFRKHQEKFILKVRK